MVSSYRRHNSHPRWCMQVPRRTYASHDCACYLLTLMSMNDPIHPPLAHWEVGSECRAHSSSLVLVLCVCINEVPMTAGLEAPGIDFLEVWRLEV